MSMMIDSHTTFIGAAGEHYVMYRLLSMGLIAALAPKGVPNADIVVTDVEGKLAVAIQVKTKGQRNSNGGWHMGAKQEKLKSPNLFYCFVDDTISMPSIYVLPSKTVAYAIGEAHKIWLATRGKAGRMRKDNDIRWLVPDYSKTLPSNHIFTKKHSMGWLDKYKENWALLKLGKSK